MCAQWAATGDTDWNTKMLAYLAIGHDTDGTHGKTQMLTDMEWSPTTYAGEESVTFPNGLIMKQGFIARSGNTTTVTFDAAFATVKFAQVTLHRTSDGNVYEPVIRTLTAANMTIYHDTSATGYYWQAWGY